jgi:hypothetical protein
VGPSRPPSGNHDADMGRNGERISSGYTGSAVNLPLLPGKPLGRIDRPNFPV